MAGKGPIATSTANPSNLPPRYEIRQLTPADKEWAVAIVLHSNIFHSPVWPVLYPENKGGRLLSAIEPCDYLATHQIESGLSFGVFDTEYEFKRPESAATGGALYWSELAGSLDATGDEFLSRMDFPLVSVALSYDGINPLDMPRMMDLIAVLPLFGNMYHLLELGDPRAPESWKPTEPKQVLMRNATSTRADYEGQKIMANLARFLMREAKIKGFRGIQIECAHDAVTYVWSHPPSPFKGEVISSIDSKTFVEEGETKLAFAPCQQVFTKCYVTL